MLEKFGPPAVEGVKGRKATITLNLSQAAAEMKQYNLCSPDLMDGS